MSFVSAFPVNSSIWYIRSRCHGPSDTSEWIAHVKEFGHGKFAKCFFSLLRWDNDFFFEQMYIPTYASTCATLKQLRHSHLGQVLLLSVRYEMSNSSYVAVQSMVKDKAGWYKDEPWEIVLRGMISWYFFHLFILFQWQDMFLVINRRGNLVEEHAETHVKICQDMWSCSNVCWLWATLPAVCHHSVSAWSFWHFGSCCYNLVLRRVSKVVALPDRLLQYSCSCYQLQAREIGIFEILRHMYTDVYRSI